MDEMNTILCEIETTINNRPITYVYGDDAEATPLTPAHLLHGRTLNTLPHVTIDMEERIDPTYETKETLHKRATKLSETMDRLWKKWELEYLSALRERHERQKPGKLTNAIKSGDVVLVHSDNKKRTLWDLAVVESIITGNDGITRAANIRTRNGKTNRPIVKLYPIEVSTDNMHCLDTDNIQILDTDNNRHINNSNDTRTANVISNRHPWREANIRARQRIRDWIND
ncbi:uncharacterized protein LOC102809203 [Saccoglossus kowalevskii]|uniref:Uncharacterized protein LOC102809203 n=1 Tax=Saccoglossus kowalevskii TaxID=10224 RepID=A0ABM0MUG4_SACKO|nr:PREDICTED: uncharacterized protein LOC102809203 [Saccoglossus kowalevskii]